MPQRAPPLRRSRGRPQVAPAAVLAVAARRSGGGPSNGRRLRSPRAGSRVHESARQVVPPRARSPVPPNHGRAARAASRGTTRRPRASGRGAAAGGPGARPRPRAPGPPNPGGSARAASRGTARSLRASRATRQTRPAESPLTDLNSMSTPRQQDTLGAAESARPFAVYEPVGEQEEDEKRELKAGERRAREVLAKEVCPVGDHVASEGAPVLARKAGLPMDDDGLGGIRSEG